jgi:hypothetical protein
MKVFELAQRSSGHSLQALTLAKLLSGEVELR